MTEFERKQAETADWLGYSSTAQMNAEHDPLHRSLCAWLGIPSHALRDAAGETLSPLERELAALEEDAVMRLQRLMHRAGARVP